MFSKEFTNIYLRCSAYREVNVLFYNKTSRAVLLFDGYEFCFMPVGFFDRELFTELEYSVMNKDQNIGIHSIRNDFDITYIKLLNGDVFQFYFMMDDNKSPQKLSIFTINDTFAYPLVESRFERSDEVEIEEWKFDSQEVMCWFDRKDFTTSI